MASFPGAVTPGNGTLVDLSDFWTAARANLLNVELIAVETAALRMHFGDGSDGAVDMDGVNTFSAFAALGGSIYTLTRDIYPSVLTVRAGITLKTAGFKIFASNSITVEATGVISNSGMNGDAATDRGGAAGSSAGGGSTAIPPAAQDGSDADADGLNGADEAYAAGGMNGINGANSSGFSGGTGGAATALPAGNGGVRNLTVLELWRSFGASTLTPFGFHAGNGGAAGGYSDMGNGGGGGGGGGNGGYMVLFAPVIANVGSITVNGGNGGNGGNASGPGNNGGGGGGNGGNGGIVAIVCLLRTGNAPSIAGGTAGTGGTGTGTDPGGDDGSAGRTGLFIELKPV